MEEVVRQDVKRVLEEVMRAVKQQDTNRIKQLSDHTIHNASVYQDEFSLTCAVTVYALAKIMTRCKEGTCIDAAVLAGVQKAFDSVHDDQSLKNAFTALLSSITEQDKTLKLYVEEVITQAKIKKGSAVFKHGISIGHAAEMLGISRWDLQEYIGKTALIDRDPEATHVEEKLRLMRELLP